MTTSVWKKTTLGEQLTFQRGFDITKSEQVEGPFPVVSSSGIKSYHDQFKVEGPGVVIGRKGTLGTAFYVNEDFWPHDTTLWVKDFHCNDPQFAYFFVQCMAFEQYDCGASNPTLNRNHIHKLPVAFPALAAQHKIASVLSAYDDLIENDTRRIAILEEMAQSIYWEWFVNFRFPGHENVKLVDSALGKIPEGWCERKLEEVTTKIGSGATPTGGKNAYKDSGISLIRSLNVYNFNFHDDGLAFIDEQQAGQLDNVTVERHDILLNITGASVARCCMVRADLLPARVNQHVAIVRANKIKVDPFFLLSTINSDRHKKQILALAQGGATREALTKMTIQKYEILLPDAVTIRRFGTIAEGIFEQREILQRKNENLRTTRDLLLSKLISGQLDVEELDIDAQKSFNGEPQA